MGLLFFPWINIIMEIKLEVIRGKRINDQLEANALKLIAERSTVDQLKTKTDAFLPMTVKRGKAMHDLAIPGTPIYRAAIGTKVLTITTDVVSQSGEQKVYKTTIIVNRVEFEDENTNDNITVTGADKQEYNFKPIPLGQNTVRVHCPCLDFHYRFRSYNARDKSSAFGAPKPYKKVPGSTRGPSNINRTPGLCKHLLATIEGLKDAKLLI